MPHANRAYRYECFASIPFLFIHRIIGMRARGSWKKKHQMRSELKIETITELSAALHLILLMVYASDRMAISIHSRLENNVIFREAAATGAGCWIMEMCRRGARGKQNLFIFHVFAACLACCAHSIGRSRLLFVLHNSAYFSIVYRFLRNCCNSSIQFAPDRALVLIAKRRTNSAFAANKCLWVPIHSLPCQWTDTTLSICFLLIAAVFQIDSIAFHFSLSFSLSLTPSLSRWLHSRAIYLLFLLVVPFSLLPTPPVQPAIAYSSLYIWYLYKMLICELWAEQTSSHDASMCPNFGAVRCDSNID